MAINLICFPYTGGNQNSYKQYKRYSESTVNIQTVEYPGRGSGAKEPLKLNLEEIITDSYHRIVPLIDSPDAIYWHSMGSLVGYLVTKLILKITLIHQKDFSFQVGRHLQLNLMMTLVN